MSVSANIDIHLATKKSTIEIIKILTDSGWNIFHNGYIEYLPLGDKDDFDWQTEKISIEHLMKILQAKQNANEVIGIIMTWKDTGIGGTFLFWTSEKYETFSLGIGIERQKIELIDDYEITNFQWYLPKLLLPLNADYFSFYEHI
ncbi:hypothetical protein GF322_00070 [Candidatus Dependentiae bacterium]|nr:hypothetical protein [Candidatus Dependentiae bacterium]